MHNHCEGGGRGVDQFDYQPIIILKGGPLNFSQKALHEYRKFQLKDVGRIQFLATFGTSVRCSSRSAFGRLTGNNVSGHYKRHYFPFLFSFFFSVVYFYHRRSARIKKLIQRKLTGTPKNLGVDTFPDPLCHFGAPWRPFWILQAVQAVSDCPLRRQARISSVLSPSYG